MADEPTELVADVWHQFRLFRVLLDQNTGHLEHWIGWISEIQSLESPLQSVEVMHQRSNVQNPKR